MKKLIHYSAFLLLTACALSSMTSCRNDNKPVDKTIIADKASIDSIVSVDKKDLKGTIKGGAGALYFEDCGQKGSPVVFVHSFGGSTKHWQAQVDHLKKDRRVITLDLRGHGQSDAPEKMDYAAESLAADIAAVVDSLQVERFVLVGHSMGGAAAIAYAGAHPERIAGLLLTGTSGKSSQKEAKPIIASLESKNYNTVMEDYTKHLLKNAKPEVDSLERQGMRRFSKETNIGIIKAIFKYNPLPDLTRYAGPKLIVSTPEENQPNSLAAQMPAIPHKIITGTSHWSQMDKPDEFNKILDEFLKTIYGKK
jgi:pimeloyl-ACP methyl ester carboxylesterase